MLPYRARDCVQYDPAQRQLHAHRWDGTRIHCDTPAELDHALATECIYSPLLVSAAALWFAADHGVDWQLPIGAPEPIRTLASRGTTEGYSPSTLQRCLSAFDRGYDRTCRLAVELLSADDHLCILDPDGLCAQVLMHVMGQTMGASVPRLSWVRTDLLPSDATIVLLHTGVNQHGVPTDHTLTPALVQAQQRAIPRYALAPFGPSDDTPSSADADINAVVTARGIYRPDRVARYHDDADIGPDIISLT